MVNILVSACLLGNNCRYDGKNCFNENVLKLKDKVNLIPICPEQMGGLPTPRVPSEIIENKIINKEGFDVSANYAFGAIKALEIAKQYNCKYALLKQKSPSCGVGLIYDGTFTGQLKDGDGNTTKVLKENGIICFNEDQIDKLLELIIDKSIL